jgi:hypothetical protein
MTITSGGPCMPPQEGAKTEEAGQQRQEKEERKREKEKEKLEVCCCRCLEEFSSLLTHFLMSFG